MEMPTFVPDEVGLNCDTYSSSSLEPKRKRRRIERDAVEDEEEMAAENRRSRTLKRWRTEREQQIYSSKLLQALRHVRGRSRTQSSGRGRDVRETADRVLAVSAKGATRWSRAIMARSLSLRLNKRRHRRVKVPAVSGCNRLKMKPELRKTKTMLNKKNKLAAVERKLRVLGQLIPGCRKASFSNLLEEATDYIPALEMQVRAMAAIAEILSAAPLPSSADDRLGANVSS